MLNLKSELIIACLPLALLLGACQGIGAGSPEDSSQSLRQAQPIPPVAAVRPTALEMHGHVRTDDYYWLKERESAEVVAYLEAENAYTGALLEHTTDLQEELTKEMVGRVRQDDETVPYMLRGYLYYTRYEDGKDYPIHCRKNGSTHSPEEILLNLNEMGADGGYLGVGARAITDDGKRMLYGIDRQGRRIYTLEVKDLETGEISDRIDGVTSNCTWAADGVTFFYAKKDPETLRSYQIWRHRLGTEQSSDALVYEETDDTFSCYVSKTRSGQFIVIHSRQTLTSDTRLLSADDPLGNFLQVLPRQRGHEYSFDHHGDHFYFVSNHEAPNFRLMRTPMDAPSMSNWEEIIPHRPDVLLEDVEFFVDFMVIDERREGLTRLRIRSMQDGAEHEIEFEDPAYSVGTRNNYEFDSSVLRLTYSSLTTPNSTYDYDMRSRKRTLLKRTEILGDFDPKDYQSERFYATAQDGTQVPISLVYKLEPDAKVSASRERPLLLYAYGSYGSSSDARFSPNTLSLLDRGFTYAIAHVRGGQEMGRHWYEDGKLMNKINTFTDFIDCGQHLVDAGYTSPDKLCAMGGSAGGLLMGAIVNVRPDLFQAVVAAVPFVDVVTTMLDDTIPLTTFEYDEWGNPNEKAAYDYMLSYSPYDQVGAHDYPNMLVTTGLHDSQVQYWEPAKWVAKLRAQKTGEQLLLLKTEMQAGHGGASGRYARYKNQALVYAFLLDMAGTPTP